MERVQRGREESPSSKPEAMETRIKPRNPEPLVSIHRERDRREDRRALVNSRSTKTKNRPLPLLGLFNNPPVITKPMQSRAYVVMQARAYVEPLARRREREPERSALSRSHAGGEGVGLELGRRRGAHSPIPKFFTKTFLT